MEGRGGIYLEESWWLSGVVSSLEGKSSLRKTTSAAAPLDLRAMYIYIYFIRVFFPRVSNFSFHPPSRGCLARISPCPSNNLTRVAGSSGSYRKKYYRETDERYIRNERTLLPVLSSPTEKNNGVFSRDGKGILLYS